MTVCTPQPGVVPGYNGLAVIIANGLEVVECADTVIVTGTGARKAADPRVLDALRSAADRGKRIASICTGAFVLAQAGLLDGRPATTYWPFTQEMRDRFPAIDLRPDVLFVDDGTILTSAGLATGLDLCLHLVRIDYGAAAANEVARLAVVAPVRSGDQAQFIYTSLPPENGNGLDETREWALAHLDESLRLGDLAAHARASTRTLTRRFREETGLDGQDCKFVGGQVHADGSLR